MENLEAILGAVKSKLGQKCYSKKHGTEFLAIHKDDRKEAIGIVVQTLKADGMEREQFSLPSFKLRLAEWLFPDALTQFWEKHKKRGAHEVVFRELGEVVADAFKVELIGAKAPDRVAKEYDPSKHKSFAKELDRSVLADAPKPNTAVNEEMADLLRLTDE